MLPRMPVMMITAVVTAGTPPSCSLMAMPMAVVMLLGRREASILSSMAKTRQRIATQPRLTAVPARTPTKMAGRFFFRTFTCSYRGTARHTVAGVSSQEKVSQPAA